MKSLRIVPVLVVLACASFAHAGAVDVTVDMDKSQSGGKFLVALNEIATLTVYAQVTPAQAVANNGIFGWDVDLRTSDPSILQVLSGTVARDSMWTQNASTSSSGTAETWGTHAIYDTGESNSGMGLGSKVRLFTVQVKGLAQGTAALTVESDTTSGTDFLTWGGDQNGNYGGASAQVQVSPEPATLALLGVGCLALIRRRR